MYGSRWFFCHYWQNFLPFWPKKAKKQGFFVTIFSSHATSWVIYRQYIVTMTLKVVKVGNSRYKELKKVHTPCIFSIKTKPWTQISCSENDNSSPRKEVFGQNWAEKAQHFPECSRGGLNMTTIHFNMVRPTFLAI